MYVRKEDGLKLASDLALETAAAHEQRRQFLAELVKQDDWSFVIKGHAMLEAAITELLLEHLGEQRLKAFVERLPLSGDEFGKLAAAKDLGFFRDGQRRFIRYFSTLRNGLVHRVENINFTFEQHLASLDSNQKKSFREAVVGAASNTEESGNLTSIMENAPKNAVAFALFLIASTCLHCVYECRAKRKIDRLAEDTTEKILKDLLNPKGSSTGSSVS